MRKILIFLMFMALPCLVFAEFQLGPAALYNWILAPGEVADNITGDVSIDDFTFGADARFKLGIFQATGLALFSPAYDDPDEPDLSAPAEIEVYLDGGIALDFVLLRLGLGIGPNINFVLDKEADEVVQFGGNVKLNCDVMLGDIAVSLSYLMFLEDFSMEGVDNLLEYTEGCLGLSVLFKLL